MYYTTTVEAAASQADGIALEEISSSTTTFSVQLVDQSQFKIDKKKSRHPVCLLTLMLCIAHSLSASETARQKSLAEQLHRVRPVVVQVSINTYPGEVNTTYLAPYFVDGALIVGTGVLLDDAGDVLTAAHVMNDASKKLKILETNGVKAMLSIGFSSDNAETPPRYRHGTTYIESQNGDEDDAHDLALIHVLLPRRPFSFLHPGSSVRFSAMRAQDMDEIFVCGFPANEPNMLTTQGAIASSWNGMVPKFSRDRGGAEEIFVYQGDVKSGLGDSGAPVFRTKDGAIIGIVIESNGNGIANIVPADYITDFLTKNKIKWQAADPHKRADGTLSGPSNHL